jgi:transcription elongation factor GreB
MSRYRPPRKPSSKYITPEGAQALRDELQYLWKVKRPKITQAVSEAAALGDRSENAEYIYGKKMLREIDSRVRFLTKRLDNIEVINRIPENNNKVYFGAWVTLENCENPDDHITYRIVGADEFDLSKGYISVDSPFSRRLIGRALNDEIDIAQEHGEIEYTIIEIRYK